MGDVGLIRGATLLDGRTADVRIADGRIVAVGLLPSGSGELSIDARGGLLIPGLHDHHIHIAATAAAVTSVRCGPPEVIDAAGLAAALGKPGAGWLRGVGYHDGVAGAIDRRWLDDVVPERPVRIQHRSGRLWIFNSAGLDRLLASGLTPPVGMERVDGQRTGRLFDEDVWLRSALGGDAPSFAGVSAALARVGVTGVTEISPANDAAAAAHFGGQRHAGFAQAVVLAGKAGLHRVRLDPGIRLGPLKLHLHEAHLPPFDAVVAAIRDAHAVGRAVATHCVTLTELVFTLAALREAGAMRGDRIEHASIAPDEQVMEIAALGLAVVTQPHFVAERGDAYLADIPRDDWRHLYRLRTFRAAGVPLAGGSDAPFGVPDPWAAMAAAVSRRTASGRTIAADEALTPEESLDLFLADPLDLGRRRTVAIGAAADLCLLDRGWAEARGCLSADLVRATIIGGRVVHERVDQPPVERGLRAEAVA